MGRLYLIHYPDTAIYAAKAAEQRMKQAGNYRCSRRMQYHRITEFTPICWQCLTADRKEK